MVSVWTWLAANAGGLVIVLLLLGLVVAVHRLGHFAAARLLGVTVTELSIGVGPLLRSRRVGPTLVGLRLLPLGATVHLEHESRTEAGDPEDAPGGTGCFERKPVWAQVLILCSGWLANCLVCFLVLVILGLVKGIPDLVPTNEVGSVQEGRPAARAGVRPGDRIVAVDGVRVDSFRDLVAQVRPRGGQDVTVTVDRGAERLELRMRVAEVEDPATRQRVGRVGIVPANGIVVSWAAASGAGEVLAMASAWVTRICTLPFVLAGHLYRGEMRMQEIWAGTGGPLLLVQLLLETWQRSGAAVLFFWAVTCASLGCFTMWPFPGLDGGHVVCALLRAALGERLSRHAEAAVHAVGLSIVVLAVLAMTARDVVGLLRQLRVL